MNEHDSERISGILESSGLKRTEELDDADVIVLNTCCIRENADNKFYGHLGNLKHLKEENPELKILVGGCLAQKDQELIRDRAKHVDVVFGTHNLNRVAELLRISRSEGPVVEIVSQEETDPYDSFNGAFPARREFEHSAWMTIQSGCDNSCAFCIVPQVRGAEVSRPFGGLLDEAKRIELIAKDPKSEKIIKPILRGRDIKRYGYNFAGLYLIATLPALKLDINNYSAINILTSCNLTPF